MCVNLVDYADPGRSPLERVVQLDNSARYRWALRRLKPRDRLAIVLRFEHFASYAELALRLGVPTTNAARVMLSRALRRLAAAVADRGGPGPL
jgi:DNA-directed RNA polymerase specialized sigma24 family protein